MITITNLQFWMLLSFLPTYTILLSLLLLENKKIVKKNRSLLAENTKLINHPVNDTITEMANKISDLESAIWNLEEERDMILETLDRSGVKPSDLGDEEQPKFSDLIELVVEEDHDQTTDEQYASMAESLAEKREMEADRLKDEKAEKHIEEDCDQCCQDGPEVCNAFEQLDRVDTGKKY